MISSNSCLIHSTTPTSDWYSYAAIFPSQPLLPQYEDVGTDALPPPIAVLKLQAPSHSLMTLTPGSQLSLSTYFWLFQQPCRPCTFNTTDFLNIFASNITLRYPQPSILWSYPWPCHQFTALPQHPYLKHSLPRVPTIFHHSTSPTLAILLNIR